MPLKSSVHIVEETTRLGMLRRDMLSDHTSGAESNAPCVRASEASLLLSASSIELLASSDKLTSESSVTFLSAYMTMVFQMHWQECHLGIQPVRESLKAMSF